jgi:hypothetical protein
MQFKLGAAIAALAAVALSASPDISLAQTAQESNYTTVLTERLPNLSISGYSGSLRLSIASDGKVNGYYIPDDNMAFVPVVGGLTNGQLWITVGDMGRMQINATVGKDGTMVGTAIEDIPAQSENGSAGQTLTYDFVATPAK